MEVPTKLNNKQKEAIKNMSKFLGDECYAKKKGFLESLKELFK